MRHAFMSSAARRRDRGRAGAAHAERQGARRDTSGSGGSSSEARPGRCRTRAPRYCPPRTSCCESTHHQQATNSSALQITTAVCPSLSRVRNPPPSRMLATASDTRVVRLMLNCGDREGMPGGASASPKLQLPVSVATQNLSKSGCIETLRGALCFFLTPCHLLSGVLRLFSDVSQSHCTRFSGV